MKINSIDIAAFGKLKNFHLELNDGMTVIYGENEMGKTTLMSFIRMMFYGSTGKASGIDKNLRKKYRPWNSALMAGSISFTFEGVNYRLEREFKASNSTDKISLINLDLGEKQTLSGSEDIGAKFFGLTDSAFERSVFIGETSLNSKNEAAEGELNARLSNIATTSDDDVSFEKIYLRLRSSKEALISKSRKIGKLDKAQVALEELNLRINEATKKELEATELQSRASSKEAEIKQSGDEASRLFELLKNSDKIKKKAILARYIEVGRERADAEQKIRLSDGSLADKLFLRDTKELLENKERADAQVSRLSAEIKEKEKEIAELSASVNQADASPEEETLRRSRLAATELDEEIDTTQKAIGEIGLQLEQIAPKKTVNLPLLIIGIIVAVTGGVALTLNTIAAVCIMGLGVALALLGIIVKKKVMPDCSELNKVSSELSQKLDSLLDKKQALLNEISALEDSLKEMKIKTASQKALCDSKEMELDKLNNQYGHHLIESEELAEDIKQKLAQLVSNQADENPQDTVNRLEDALGYFDILSQKLAVLSDNAGGLTLSEAEQKLAAYSADTTIKDMSEEEADSLKERFKAQSDHTGKLKSELVTIKEQLKALSASTPSVSVLERERCELLEKINGYTEFCSTADKAIAVLDEAFRDLRKNYSEVLDQRTSEIFNQLSSDKYLSVNVSKGLEAGVTTEEAFGLKESDYLSGGTEDQLELALRLAIAELITNETEKLPVFADDPLSQYDDARTVKAIRFLKDYARDKQIVMFTCHNVVRALAEKYDITTIMM